MEDLPCIVYFTPWVYLLILCVISVNILGCRSEDAHTVRCRPVHQLSSEGNMSSAFGIKGEMIVPVTAVCYCDEVCWPWLCAVPSCPAAGSLVRVKKERGDRRALTKVRPCKQLLQHLPSERQFCSINTETTEYISRLLAERLPVFIRPASYRLSCGMLLSTHPPTAALHLFEQAHVYMYTKRNKLPSLGLNSPLFQKQV